MANVPITFGCGLYDRLVPLYAGEVQPEGIDLTFVPIDVPSEVFGRMLDGEFHAGEMSSSDYLRRTSAGNCPFVAIPVFPSRVFRHSMICVNRHAGIEGPKDLEGKRVGVPHFPMTAALWIRGLLQREYGVDISSIRWMQDAPFRPVGDGAAMAQALEKTFTIAGNDTGKPLDVLLDEGTIDAFIGADIPEPMRASPHVRRLFPDFKQREQDYYRRTKIFPIMHTVVIRRDVYERHPFVARSLYEALDRSRALARQKMRYMGTLRYMLPWMIAEIEELDALFEGDPFAYGLEPNRKTLETALGYLQDQSLLLGPVSLDEAFVPVEGVAAESR
jgi:4,5-dihydroxyphthalate decarboxylase